MATETINREAYDRIRSYYQEREGSSLDIATRRDPDRHAENLRLAETQDLPIDTVERNTEEVRRRERLRGIDLEGYDRVREYFRDPDNASVSIDDIEPLKKIEDAATGSGGPPGALLRQWIEGTAGAIQSMKNILPETEEQLKQQMRGRFAGLYKSGGLKAASTPPPMWEPIAREDQFRPEIFQAQEERKVQLDKRTELAVNNLMNEISAGEKKIEELTPKDLNLWQQGLRGGAVSAMLQGPVIVGSLVSGQPWLGPVLMGEQVFAESFGSAQAEGMTVPKSLAYAGGQAGFEYIGEKLPFKNLENLFKRAGDATGEFFKYMGKEVVGEEVTALGQGTIDYIAGMDEEMESAIDSGDYGKAWDIATDRAIVTAIAAITGSGIQAGSIAALGKTVEMVAAGKAQTKNWNDVLESLEGQGRLDKLIEAAQETKTLPRAPKQFDALMQSMGESVYLTQEAAVELRDPPDYILEQMSDYGSDIEIPLNRFMVDLATDPEVMKVIRPHIRISDSGFTTNELETGGTDSLSGLLSRAQSNAELKSESEQIFEDLIPQLVATGRMSESTARTSAAIIPAYLSTYVDRARRKGDDKITVAQVYEEFFRGQGLRIVGPGVKPADITDKPEVTIMDQIPASPYAQKQDFGDIVIEDRRPKADDPGAMVTARIKLQKRWDDTQSRRENLTKMIECLIS